MAGPVSLGKEGWLDDAVSVNFNSSAVKNQPLNGNEDRFRVQGKGTNGTDFDVIVTFAFGTRNDRSLAWRDGIVIQSNASSNSNQSVSSVSLVIFLDAVNVTRSQIEAIFTNDTELPTHFDVDRGPVTLVLEEIVLAFDPSLPLPTIQFTAPGDQTSAPIAVNETGVRTVIPLQLQSLSSRFLINATMHPQFTVVSFKASCRFDVRLFAPYEEINAGSIVGLFIGYCAAAFVGMALITVCVVVLLRRLEKRRKEREAQEQNLTDVVTPPEPEP